MLSSKKLLRTLARNILYDINTLTTAVVTLTGKSLGILICKNRTCRQKNSL